MSIICCCGLSSPILFELGARGIFCFVTSHLLAFDVTRVGRILIQGLTGAQLTTTERNDVLTMGGLTGESPTSNRQTVRDYSRWLDRACIHFTNYPTTWFHATGLAYLLSSSLSYLTIFVKHVSPVSVKTNSATPYGCPLVPNRPLPCIDAMLHNHLMRPRAMPYQRPVLHPHME